MESTYSAPDSRPRAGVLFLRPAWLLRWGLLSASVMLLFMLVLALGSVWIPLDEVAHILITGEASETALEGLRSATGFLRTKVAKALGTRVVPELHFEIDRGREHAARINEVLASLHREESGD